MILNAQGEKVTSLDIPLYYCAGVTITIPGNSVIIGMNTLGDANAYGFKLKEIKIGEAENVRGTILDFNKTEDGLGYRRIGNLVYISYGKKFEQTNVVIPPIIDNATVISIEDAAFDGNEVIESVIIPDTVIVIGERAFRSRSEERRVGKEC